MRQCTSRSDNNDGFDFKLATFGQAGYANGGTCRIRLGDDVGHDGVGACKFAEIRKEQRELHDVIQRTAGSFDDGLQVGKCLANLPFKVFGNQFPGVRFKTQLARNVDGAALLCRDSLRIGTHSGRSGIRMDNFFRHKGSSGKIDMAIKVYTAIAKIKSRVYIASVARLYQVAALLQYTRSGQGVDVRAREVGRIRPASIAYAYFSTNARSIT